jgi:hypothetical protein
MNSQMETDMRGSSIQGNSLFQQEEGGSSPTLPLQVREISLQVARPFIEHWHYSHKTPTGKGD